MARIAHTNAARRTRPARQRSTVAPKVAGARGGKRKAAALVVARAKAKKATTFRLAPELESGLRLLRELEGRTANEVVNQAVREYLGRRTGKIEHELRETLARVREFRRKDPQNKRLWAEFAEAEAKYSDEDPAEGASEPRPGPAQSLVQELLRG